MSRPVPLAARRALTLEVIVGQLIGQLDQDCGRAGIGGGSGTSVTQRIDCREDDTLVPVARCGNQWPTITALEGTDVTAYGFVAYMKGVVRESPNENTAHGIALRLTSGGDRRRQCNRRDRKASHLKVRIAISPLDQRHICHSRSAYGKPRDSSDGNEGGIETV
jgi:hypothetical protein